MDEPPELPDVRFAVARLRAESARITHGRISRERTAEACCVACCLAGLFLILALAALLR